MTKHCQGKLRQSAESNPVLCGSRHLHPWRFAPVRFDNRNNNKRNGCCRKNRCNKLVSWQRTHATRGPCMSWSIELAEDIEYSNFFGYSCPLAIFRPQREFSRFVSSRRTIFKKHYLIADQIFSYAKTRFSLTLHILSFIFPSAHIVEKWRDDESFPHWLAYWTTQAHLKLFNYSAWIFDFCPKNDGEHQQIALFTVESKVFSTTTGKTTGNSEEPTWNSTR